jgi:Uma2 family endonuclease
MSEMALDHKLREFTSDEYRRMVEAGIIAEDEGVELLDGQLVLMSPIGSRHAGRHSRLVRYLTLALGDAAVVLGMASIPLGDRSEPNPDIAIASPRADSYESRHPRRDEILALIEISESSLAKDAGPKAKLYARSGIRDYLIADIEANVLRWNAEPHELGYARTSTLGYGDAFTLTALPDITLSADPFLAPRVGQSDTTA